MSLKLIRSHLARDFAGTLADAMTKGSLAKAVRHGSPHGEVPKETATEVSKRLAAFLRSRNIDTSPGETLYDWEGNHGRAWPQSRSYEILGTSAHPDAAVIRPFTCAFEFDREPASEALSHFKAALLKASVHVLCGAYDACVMVYLLRGRWSSKTYLEDGSLHTSRLINALRAQGVRIAFVPP